MSSTSPARRGAGAVRIPRRHRRGRRGVLVGGRGRDSHHADRKLPGRAVPDRVPGVRGHRGRPGPGDPGGPVRSAFSLTEAERARRCDLLIRATTVPEPTRLTEAGLRLLLAAATAPQVPETLPEQLRPQLQRLITAGLVGSDGRLVPEAANVAEVMRRPAIWLQ